MRETRKKKIEKVPPYSKEVCDGHSTESPLPKNDNLSTNPTKALGFCVNGFSRFCDAKPVQTRSP